MENVEVHFEKDKSLLDLFSDPETVQAVDDVTLDIPENDVVALVGESGSGKTTLGKSAIGLIEPTAGHVKFRGQDIWKAKRGEGDIPFETIRRSLQIIHQDPGSSLNPNLKVITSLTAPLQKWENIGREEARSRVYGMLNQVGMSPPEDYAERYPHQLSGGEQQRIALVRTLMMNPDLILADEAISALDVSLRVEMMDLMFELQDAFNTSFLFISHDISNAKYIASHANGRIGIMYLGELVEIGPVDEVLENPTHPYTKVLKWATPSLTEDLSKPGEPPVREIDIPDPVNPPSGCRFHTRCPEAREVCTRSHPNPTPVADATETEAACFRAYGSDHEYWDSTPLEEETTGQFDE